MPKKKAVKKTRNSSKKQLGTYKTFINVLIGITVVLALVIVTMIVAYLYLQTQHTMLVQQHQDYIEANKTAFENTMIWQMDDSCATQFENSDKLLLVIEKSE